MIGYYLGSLGEMQISTNLGFKLVGATTGAQIYPLLISFEPSGVTTACLDGTTVCRSTNSPPYYGWTDNWRLTLGHFDGDIDELRISNVLRP